MKKTLFEYLRNLSGGMFAGFADLSGAFKPLAGGYDASPFLSQAFKANDLPSFFQGLFNMAIALGAMLAVLRLAYAGFVYMTTDIWSSKENAKEVITNAILGLLLLLAVWLILKQINPDILNLDILRSLDKGGGTS